MRYKRWKNIAVFLLLFILFAYDLNGIAKVIQVSNKTTSDPFVPIIMYHHVKNSQPGKDSITLSEFENDLKYLENNNYNTITMGDLIDYVYNDKDLPENPIILSFDDGLLSTYANVYPLLQKYNMKIVLSILGLSSEKFSKTVDENIEYSHATWEQLNEMQASGLVEIQNHSYDMHSTTNGRYGIGQKKNESFDVYETYLTEDVTLFNETVKLTLNTIPNTFTYPYGKYNDNSEIILKKLGFKATLTCKFGVNIISKNKDCLYEMKRICRAHNQGIEKVLKEVNKNKFIREFIFLANVYFRRKFL